MKKILLLAVLFGSLKSFGQYPVKQHIGGDSTEVWGTMFWGKKGVVNGIYIDTASANLTRIKEYPYAQIATDTTLWLRDMMASKWMRVGNGGDSGIDTVYVTDDLYITIDSTGHQIIHRLHNDGRESGGILTSAGCMDIQITSTTYYLHGIRYISPATVLTVSAADPTNGRKDLVVADSLGNVYLITGTPSPIPSAPNYNPGSQIVINEIEVPAGATCLSIGSIVIYDETGGTEYTPSTSGTITADPNNTDNPQHLTKAYFISSYADGAKITFTKISGQDTVFNNSVFAGFIWLNGSFVGHQIQMQLFLTGASVSNNIVLNPYFNVLDSNEYQPLSIPAYAFAAGGNIIFDSIVYTLAGNDLSGAKGFYLDFLQLQTGINNVTSGKGVIFYGKNAAGDSTILLREDGVRFAAKDSSGGGGTTYIAGSNVSITGGNTINASDSASYHTVTLIAYGLDSAIVLHRPNGVSDTIVYTPAAADWHVTGNAGTDTLVNFLGTTDNKPLLFRTNNIRSGFISDTLARNTAFGYEALLNNPLSHAGITDTSEGNTAFGFRILKANTKGSYNTGIGLEVLKSNTLGYSNNGVGYQALFKNTTGFANASIGYQTLYNNISGYENVAIAPSALFTNTTGFQNVGVGLEALYGNSTGQWNTAVGYLSGRNVSGSYNTSVGAEALRTNTGGSANTAVGLWSLYANTASSNSAYGTQSLYNNSTGTLNTALGYFALGGTTTGDHNVGVGHNAGFKIADSVTNATVVNNGIYIGYNTKTVTSAENNAIVIGTYGQSLGSNRTVIGNAATTYTNLFGVLNVGITTDYADNAAALTGGLVVGDVYRTGDVLKIVH